MSFSYTPWELKFKGLMGPSTSRAACFQNPVEKIQFYMDHRREREQQILAALRDATAPSCTVTDIVTAVYTVSTDWSVFMVLLPMTRIRSAAANGTHNAVFLFRYFAVNVASIGRRRGRP